MLQTAQVMEDMAACTDGDIYIGVVGPVRTGKSTFIKRFMEQLVLPGMEPDSRRDRALDELPQSASGRTIMTTEPKFIPEKAVTVRVDDSAAFDVRMIDCVGYIVPSALGYIEDDQPRMVMTPWYEEPIPFNMAAEIGTRKVITEHSTIGLVITTDGSISEIPREEYEEAEERVIRELQEIRKPFVVLLNCLEPDTEEARALAAALSEKYRVPVMPVSCLDMDEEEIRSILAKILCEFPVREIQIEMPRWIASLEKGHWLREAVFTALREAGGSISRVRELSGMVRQVCGCEQIQQAELSSLERGSGLAKIQLQLSPNLFYRILGEKTGIEIHDEGALFRSLQELSAMKREYEKIRQAYEDVKETGYGIVMPDIDELTLEEPEIIRQGSKYGIRLKAAAPSIHLMRTQICTELTPIVGSEQQSEELVMYLLKEFEESPGKIWESNIFGKSLHELVNEGLHNKLYRMPDDARNKLRETIERIINDGCSGLICIIL